MEDKGSHDLKPEAIPVNSHPDRLFTLSPVTPEYIQKQSEAAYSLLHESGALGAVLQVAKDHLESGDPNIRLEMGWTAGPRLQLRGEAKPVFYPAKPTETHPAVPVGMISPGVEISIDPQSPNGHIVRYTEGSEWIDFRNSPEARKLVETSSKRGETLTLYDEIWTALTVAKPYYELGRDAQTGKVVAPLEKNMRPISVDHENLANWGKLV